MYARFETVFGFRSVTHTSIVRCLINYLGHLLLGAPLLTYLVSVGGVGFSGHAWSVVLCHLDTCHELHSSVCGSPSGPLSPYAWGWLFSTPFLAEHRRTQSVRGLWEAQSCNNAWFYLWFNFYCYIRDSSMWVWLKFYFSYVCFFNWYNCTSTWTISRAQCVPSTDEQFI